MKLKKIVTIITILFLLLNTICLAKVDTDAYKPNDLTNNDYEKAFAMTGKIVNGLTLIGTVIAIIGIMILGIKYMIGSVEEKAEYKKTMIPYLVGCIFIFAITRIVSIIYSLVVQIQ